MTGLLIEFGVPVFLLLLGITIGRAREARHFRSLDQREADNRTVPVDNRKRVDRPEEVTDATLLCSQVVIATDYFKSFAMALRNLVGGEARSAERLMQRARREGLLRIIEQAHDMGYHEVWNVRYQFSNINMMSRNRGAMQVEMFVYATAVRRSADAA